MEIQTLLRAMQGTDPKLLLLSVIIAILLCVALTSVRDSLRKGASAKRMAALLASAVREEMR